jgi:hypothetical protein
MKHPAPKRLVIGAFAQLTLAIIVAFSTGAVWLLNASMLRSSPPTGIQQFDTYLAVGFIASVVLAFVAAFHVDATRRILRSS